MKETALENRYITIDSGTTNTRICLVSDKKIIQPLFFHVGATKSIRDKDILSNTIKSGIEKLLLENRLTEKDIACVLCCGMITSEFGLVNLEHICTPAGIDKLQQSIFRCHINEITCIPFAFIRGVKTDFSSLESADIMRGEETEVMGVFSGKGLYVLPGSHSKIITVDENGVIVGFKTMLTGEMLSAIAQGTILKDSVSLQDHQIDKEHLVSGYLYARDHGLNEALFKLRLLKNFFHKQAGELYNFYLGAVLHGEIGYLLSEKEKQIFVGGKRAIKNAIAVLLDTFSDKHITVLSDTCVEHSLVNGMIRIYEGENGHENY